MSKDHDSANRCPWAGPEPIYATYHDDEWGVPKTDDRALFEKLVLEGFQAGLSWITILKKRDHFRTVFDGFEPAVVARYDSNKIEELMADPGIIRNRAKIEATVNNARACLQLQQERSLASFLWEFVDGEPQMNAFRKTEELPAQTPVSKEMAKALKARGFRFFGPATAYAFMQSVGMVNDHLVTCHRYGACADLARGFVAPGS
jgi:DNA-3-methyladenine glycosylase I